MIVSLELSEMKSISTFDYKCKCGSSGSAKLAFENTVDAQPSGNPLVTVKNRLCCPADESPLVTILAKNLDTYKCEIVCKSCNTIYKEEKGQ